jgi:hypothetical protein
MTLVCSGRRYKYKGIVVEITGIGGPWALKRNGDPYERLPAHVSVKLDEFLALPQEERDIYRAGGGCEVFP